MSTVAELRSEFATVHRAAKAVLDSALAQKRELTPEEAAANEKRFARLEKISAQLSDHRRLNDMMADAMATGGSEFAAAQERLAIAAGHIDRAAFSHAAAKWAATGEMEKRFATITTATQSGIFLPVEVIAPLVPIAPNTFRQAFTVYGLNPLQTPTTAQMNVPILTAVAGGEVAENATSETENEPSTSGSIASAPKTYQSGSSWFSNNVLSANGDFDLIGAYTPAWLQNKELGVEAAITTGIMGDAGITQVVTTATAAVVTVDDLTNLDEQLPKRYQQQKVIVLGQATYAAARALRFASGGFVLTVDQNGIARFNGTPVLRNDNFQALSAGNKLGCIFSLPGFHLRDAGQVKIERYTQVPAKPDQSGFNLIGYHAYGYDPNGIALFKSA